MKPTDRQLRVRAEQAAIRALLVEKFPNCFAPKGAPKKPLKVGIYHDIRKALGLPAKWLGLALRDYTGGPLYLKAMTEHATRFDLDGNDAGWVTAQDAVNAEQRLEKINQKLQRKQPAA